MGRGLLLVIAIAMGGCGGGSSGDSNPSSSRSVSSTMKSEVSSSSSMGSSQSSANSEFGLHKLNSMASGVVYTARLEAINNLGYTVVGEIWITNGAEELLNGVLVTPRIIDFKECSGDCTGSNSLFPRVAWTVTNYIETTTGNLIAFKQKNFFHSEILNCKSVSPYHMPLAVKFGDSGVTSDFTCGETVFEGNAWGASKKADNHIVLSIKSHGYDANGKIEEVEILYTLDGEGNIVSLTAGGLSSRTMN